MNGILSVVRIRGLRVSAWIGVGAEERSTPQELLVDVDLRLGRDFTEMADDIAKTVDYDSLCKELSRLAAERPRKLLETLAADCAALALARPGVEQARVEIRKFILPETEHVAVVYEAISSGG